MRTFKFFLAALICSTVFLSSCDKENDSNNDNNNNQPPTENKISATVDGTSWTADTSTITGIYTSAAGFNNIAINGAKADGSFFTLSLNLWNGQTGTFSTATVATSNIVGLTYEDSNGDSWAAPSNNSSASGTLIIDYWDGTKVKGRFNFTGGRQQDNQTVTVTDGTFSAINVQ